MSVPETELALQQIFDHEHALPLAPLPTLQDSSARFLDWCAPLLDAAQQAATGTAVTEFLAPGSPAWRLHSALAERDATERGGWLDAFWSSRYLGRRDRIALNANFFFLFPDAELDQVNRAAGLVAAAMDYKLRIDRGEIPAPVVRGKPQSMAQLPHLFGTTRIPGERIDTVRTPFSDAHPGPTRARHIVVLFAGHMFRFDVIDPGGLPYPPDELAAGLRAIMAAAPGRADPGQSVGQLTTKARAEWAASRSALLACDPSNAEQLKIVETALLCLCLEGTEPAGPHEAADRLLHGDSANRWFDKSLSLIVFGDGTAGLNGEHCLLDGITMVTFTEAVVGSPVRPRVRDSGSAARVPAFAPITFVLDEELRTDIRAAGEAFQAAAADTVTRLVEIEHFTSQRGKELGISPDAFVQLALQLAHRRARGHLGSTYESIATRHFRYGRTEAMRVVTPEIVKFVAVMNEATADAATKQAAVRSAAAAHVARVRACQAGDAPEQHLWALQMLQQDRGVELGATEPLALYDSPGWRIMRSDYLSTSAVSSPQVRYFGFGSTSPTCIGVGYTLLPDRFSVYLSTPRAEGATMDRFAEELQRAVTELVEVLGRR